MKLMKLLGKMCAEIRAALFGSEFERKVTVGIAISTVCVVGLATGFANYDNQRDARELSRPIPADRQGWEENMRGAEIEVQLPLHSVPQHETMVKRLNFLEAQAKKLQAQFHDDGKVHDPRLPSTTKTRTSRITAAREAEEARLKTASDYGLYFSVGNWSEARYIGGNLYTQNLEPTMNLITDWLSVLFWPALCNLAVMFLILWYFKFQLNERNCRLMHAFGTWQFWGAWIVWPVGLAMYPHIITPAQHLEHVRRFLGYAFGLAAPIAIELVPAIAQTASPTPAAKAVTSGIKKKFDVEAGSHIVADNAVVFSNEPYVNTTLTLERNDCSVAFNFSKSLSNRHPDGGNYAGITGMCSVTRRGWKFGGYGALQPAEPYRTTANDALVIGASIQPPSTHLGKVQIEPTVNFDHFFGLPGSGVKGGSWVSGGAAFSRQLNRMFKVSVNTKLLYDNGTFGFGRALVGNASAKLEMKFTKNFTLRVVQRYTKPITLFVQGDGRHAHGTTGLGLAYEF